MSLLTVEQLKAYCRNVKAVTDDEFIQMAVDYVDEFLWDETGCEWVVSSTSTARSFVPPTWGQVLRIHDCTAVSSVVSNGSTLAAGDYQLEPVGGRDAFGRQVPYNQIRLINGGAWYHYANKATVVVTAAWGQPSIPARITQAALIIGKEIVQNRDDVKLGLVDLGDIGAGVARTNRIVAATINAYRRAETWGIG